MAMKLGGVHAPHAKNTAGLPPVEMPAPGQVTLSMSQHIGAPCVPTVKVGDLVKVGQVVGDNPGKLCVPVHASVSGKVSAIVDLTMPNGTVSKAVVIQSDGEQAMFEGIAPPRVDSLEDFIEAVRQSGLVGLGGAGFPTYQKLKVPAGKVDSLVVNGAECEPYLTTDHRAMLDHAEDILEGVRQVMERLNIPSAYLCVEDNKPDAIGKLTELSASMKGVSVVSMKAVYPKGAEKVTVYNATGRVVPEGKLPLDVGCIVMNVNSLAFLAQYMRTGVPLIRRTLTVDGDAVKVPKNVTAPIGAAIEDVLAFAGGLKEEPMLVLMGGPMMGLAVNDTAMPILKNNNGLLAFTRAGADRPRETACIRCGRCVKACPVGLMPAAIENAYKLENKAMLEKLKVNICMECGCCAYVCPAKRDLVLTNRLAKKMLKG